MTQSENYYKAKLSKQIDKFLTEATKGDNDLGWIDPNLVENMTNSAWLILKSSMDVQDFLTSEGHLN